VDVAPATRLAHPYHKKEPAGFHDGEPSQVGMEGKHHGNGQPLPTQNQARAGFEPATTTAETLILHNISGDDDRNFFRGGAEWGAAEKIS
jgi:hypothetical protein